MKKTLKHFVVAVAMLLTLSSCGVLNQTASQGSILGSSTGSALSSVIKILKQVGALDLSNLTNIINLGQILTGASSLQNATSAIQQAAAAAATGTSPQLTSSSAGVSETLATLNAISKLIQ